MSTLAPDVAMRRLLRVPPVGGATETDCVTGVGTSLDQAAPPAVSSATVETVSPSTSADATAQAHRIFSASILLSATRCLLGYVLFPIVSPALGAAAGVGPAVGIPLGILALVFDVRGIRRFWLANHRYRWPITGLYLVVMVLVTVLLVRDLAHVF